LLSEYKRLESMSIGLWSYMSDKRRVARIECRGKANN
jgi:hypothetical protein